MARLPLIQRDNYTVWGEQFNGITFMHCDIHTPWRAGVKRRLLEDFTGLLSLRRDPVFAINESGQDKHRKWLSVMGFAHAAKAECLDGQTRDIFVRQG